MSREQDLDRRSFVRLAAVTAATLSTRGNVMTQALSNAGPRTNSSSAEIRPFHFTASDAELTDLRRRINATRWPEREWTQDSSDGVPLGTMQKLARYWGSQYD
jgi:hypothetical protein